MAVLRMMPAIVVVDILAVIIIISLVILILHEL